MVSRRYVVALLCSALASAASAGCAGVPEAGAVHLAPAAPNVAGGAQNLVQKAQGPQAGASKVQIVNEMLAAMSEGDTDAIKEFFTAQGYSAWQNTEATKTTIFSSKIGPAPVAGDTSADAVEVTFTLSGTIGPDLSYQRQSGTGPAKFTLSHASGEWRIASISPGGTYVSADSLPQVDTPARLYFPSGSAPAGTVPRLVPDTIFLPNTYAPAVTTEDRVQALVTQLLGGPTDWLAPAVTVAVPTTTTLLVPGVQIDPRTSVTTINLSAVPAQSDIATLKAQLAYTLQPVLSSAPIQLEFNGVPAGGQFSYPDRGVSADYGPDADGADSPLYYISAGDTLQSAARGIAANAPSSVNQDAPGGFSSTPVIGHLLGVKRIAIAPTVDGSGATRVAGVRLDVTGAAQLELSALGDNDADPWTTVTIPGARGLSTPSFDATADSVWTVATLADGTSVLYRVPVTEGVAGTPVAVPLTGTADGSVLSAFRLSRDGARAALIASGQTYTAVVARSAAGAWSVQGARRVITVANKTADVDVYWSDQSTLGVVVQAPATGSPLATFLYTVSADGYTLGQDGESTDHNTVAGDYSGATQFAGGPGQLWVASLNGSLTRQPVPDASEDSPTQGASVWVVLDGGTWPAYSG